MQPAGGRGERGEEREATKPKQMSEAGGEKEASSEGGGSVVREVAWDVYAKGAIVNQTKREQRRGVRFSVGRHPCTGMYVKNSAGAQYGQTDSLRLLQLRKGINSELTGQVLPHLPLRLDGYGCGYG